MDRTTALPIAAFVGSRSEHPLVTDLRKLAAAATAGLVVGFVVNGWGSRLAMMLLAQFNPEDAGRLSDDGFIMGRFDLGATMGLIAFTTLLGIVGGVIFLAVRHLRFGPGWFQSTSITIGPAVVVGAMLVHTDGIDFTQLEPSWLGIALFVTLPGLFAHAVTRLGDHWLCEDSWFLRSRRLWILGLLPLLPVLPLLPLIAVALLGRLAYHRSRRLRSIVSAPAVAWVARGGLTALFVVALIDLTRDTLTLT